jgi:glycosyltransferase involved in cell wall biosynthesis
MKTVDIVLPAYNEEEGIAAFHEALAAAIRPLESRYRFQVIYVLDRSRDNTFGILKDLTAGNVNVTVLHLSRRFGHQMSLVAGIDHSDADAVIMMDCDQQHPPSMIPLLLQKFEEGYEIVHTIREYDRKTGFMKRSTSQLFYRLQNALSPVDLPVGAADFRLISRKVAKVFRTAIREQNQFLRGLFQWIGFSTTTITYTTAPRKAGRTKYQPGRLLTFAIAGMLSFSKLPLRLASLIGFAISSLSLIYGMFLIFYFFWAGHIPPGYTSMIVIILFMGGLQLTVLGIIGEYLGSIFDEVKGRPLYVIDEIVRSERT